MVWVDAEGSVVEGVVALPEGISQGAPLNYVDEDGYFWPLDPFEVGENAFMPELLWANGSLPIVFADSDCTEPWSGTVPVPRVVAIVIAGDYTPQSLDGHTYVAPDDVQESNLAPAYSLYYGNCEDIGFNGRVALDDLIEVAPPSTWWVPPLHPEYR